MAKEARRNNRSIFLGFAAPRVVAPVLVYPWYTAAGGAYRVIGAAGGIRSGYFCSTP